MKSTAFRKRSRNKRQKTPGLQRRRRERSNGSFVTFLDASMAQSRHRRAVREGRA